MSVENEDDVSLRDEIASAFTSENAKTDDVNNESVIDKLEERERDDQGRFAKKEEAKVEEEDDDEEEDDEGEQATDEPSVRLSPEKAPSSWSPKVREKWGELPEDVRAEIIRREEASASGVRKLQEEYAPIHRFAEAMSPFLQEASRMGQDPTGYIANVMVAERQLRHPDQEMRFHALLNIADSYGIPLRQIINRSVGQEILHQPQQQQGQQMHPAVQQELAAMRQWREQQENQTIESQINAFKKDKEFFEDVRDLMADLMDSGVAKDLQDAYDKACWTNPEVREVLRQRELSGTKKDAIKNRQAAAAGASVKASGQADIQVDTDDDDSIEASVRRAMREASGRV